MPNFWLTIGLNGGTLPRDRVVAMADSILFANSSLGFTKNVPSKQQLKLYDLEFWMLGQLIQMPGEVWQDENSEARK